jgi:transcription initiation factor TFIID subunit TAF12
MVNHLQAYCKHAQIKAHAQQQHQQQQQQQQQAPDSTLLATMSTLSSSTVMGSSTTLRQSQTKPTGVTGNDTLTVLVLHCIWNAIVRNKRSEARFLQCEVMYIRHMNCIVLKA